MESLIFLKPQCFSRHFNHLKKEKRNHRSNTLAFQCHMTDAVLHPDFHIDYFYDSHIERKT